MSAPRPRFADGQFNVIEIVIDTLSAHWIGCYGNTAIRTPNIDALAARSVMFMDAYPNALPTVPTRRGLFTGRQIFPSYMVSMREGGTSWRGWHPLYREDTTQAEAFRNAGYTTHLIADTYHFFQPAMNFQFGFDCFEWVRGQEFDRYATGPQRELDTSKYIHASTPGLASTVTQYLLNRHSWKGEEDWPTHRLFRTAGEWLDKNVEDTDPFYLHIECYSPHEMWDPPEDYYRLYMKSDYNGPRLIFPPQTTQNMSAVELEHVRALYGGLVTFVDSRLGLFLKKVEAMGLMNNTIVVLTTDHGTFMGEQGNLHKGEGQLRTQLLHVPLLIYHPDFAGLGRRIKGYVQHTDIMPTLLDLNGIARPARVTGDSLRGLMETGADSPKGFIYGGWNNHGFIRTPDWSFVSRWNAGVGFEDLYNAREDPLELTNLNGKYDSVTADFKAKLQAHIAASWEITRGNFLQVTAQ
jgi:arylsulfatase A-like enzyme